MTFRFEDCGTRSGSTLGTFYKNTMASAVFNHCGAAFLLGVGVSTTIYFLADLCGSVVAGFGSALPNVTVNID